MIVRRHFYIIKGLLAGSYGQAVTVALQFFLVPFFISAWGVDAYGGWLVMMALPMLVSYGDFGIGVSATNDFSKALRHNDKSAVGIFYTGLLGLTVVSVSIFLLATILANVDNSLYGPFLVMCLYATFSIFVTYIFNSARATSSYPKYIFIFNSIRLIEGVAVGAFLTFSATQLEVAFCYLLIRFFGGLVLFSILIIDIPSLNKLTLCLDYILHRDFWYKSGMAALMPVSLALSLQVPLFLAQSLGSKAVVLFSVTRLVGRVPVQFYNVLAYAVWPKMFSQDMRNPKSATIFITLIIFIFCIIWGAVVYTLSDYIFPIWLKGELNIDKDVLIIMLAIGALNALWMGMTVYFQANNMHREFTVFFFVLVLLSLLFLWGLSSRMSVLEFCFPLLTLELIMVLFMLKSMWSR